MGDRMRVLLVDDDAAVADVTATYLERFGESMAATVETSPTDALDCLGDGEFDCVVSDYEMPEMDGLAFLDEVRAVAPDLPFVLFTGRGSEEIASEAISAGVTDYLQKETGTEQYEVLANRVENAVAQYRAQREAEEANREVTRLLDRVTDAFFALDDDWRFRYVNDRAAELFGHPVDELVGEDIRELFPEGVETQFHDAYRRAWTTQEPMTVEAESSVAPGTWMESRAYPAEDGLSVYGRDVTERKRMAAERRATKRKIESLYDIAARAVACTTADEIYDLAVEAAEDILEFDLCTVDTVEDGELVPQAISADVPPDGYYETTSLDEDDNVAADVYHSGESHLVRNVQAEGRSSAESAYRSALTVPLGDYGVFQAVSTEANGFDDDDRELAELLATHLTEALRRIESERALRAERDRFAALFENVPNAVVSCVYEDDRPVVRAVNPAFEEAFGWSASEVVGEPLDEYIVPADRRGEAETFNEQARCGAHVEGEAVRRETADGLRDFLLNTAPAVDDESVEDVSVYTEITDQKERQRELARQNERLDEFASVVSHDLRNPLNVAQGRLELLAEEEDSDHLEPIGTALDRIDALVADLLALARQGEPVSDEETVTVDLRAVATDAWATAETGDAGLVVESEATVEGSPGRVRQLLENLFRNSVEHGDSDVTVRVGDLGESAGFFVADDGPGIPEDEREKVFEHGFTTGANGTGLGLSIVTDIVDAHGWSVEIEESDAGGTRFVIRTG